MRSPFKRTFGFKCLFAKPIKLKITIGAKPEIGKIVNETLTPNTSPLILK